VGHVQAGGSQQAQRRAAIEHLQCRLELPMALLQDGLEDLCRQLADLAHYGLVEVLDDRIVITEAGRHDLLGLCAGLQVLAAAV